MPSAPTERRPPEAAVLSSLPAFLRRQPAARFNIDASRRVTADDRAGLESLLEYMERPPVALERLEYLSDGRVLYKGRWNPSLKRDHQLLPAMDFLALLVPHELLRYQISIRSYGAASTTIPKRLGWIKKPAPTTGAREVTVVESNGEFLKVRKRSWARLIQRVWLDNPEICPSGKKEMKVLAAISSPAQDDVIEKILRSSGRWDPPWLKGRPARGPPEVMAPHPSTLEAWIDPPPPDEGYFQDPEGES